MISIPDGRNLVSIPDTVHLDQAEFKPANTMKASDEIRTAVRLISRGVYSPLKGFNTSDELSSILKDQRLPDGTIWAMPVLLPADESSFAGFCEGEEILIVDSYGPVATIRINEKYTLDMKEASIMIFGTSDPGHPGVERFLRNGSKYMGGTLTHSFSYRLPFQERVMYPKETREYFQSNGWKRIVAFQTRNIPHLGHEYMHMKALETHDGLFINPVIGRKKAGDFRDEAIIAAYDAMQEHYYPAGRVLMAPINYEMQYAGPREALHHAIMRKNFGATSFIVGRDHAGVGSYYDPLEAQRNCLSFPDLGIEILKFEEASYCQKCKTISEAGDCSHPDSDRVKFSGTDVRRMLITGDFTGSKSVRMEVLNAVRAINPMFQS